MILGKKFLSASPDRLSSRFEVFLFCLKFDLFELTLSLMASIGVLVLKSSFGVCDPVLSMSYANYSFDSSVSIILRSPLGVGLGLKARLPLRSSI